MSENNSAVKATKTIHDMTTGSPAKLIVQFMIPMFLGNIFQQFYNVADSIIAGQFLGVRALAAIGSTGSLMFFVTGWLNGLSSGFAREWRRNLQRKKTWCFYADIMKELMNGYWKKS